MDDKKPRRTAANKGGRTGARGGAAFAGEPHQMSPLPAPAENDAADFPIVAEPTATSTIAISTALSDDEALASSADDHAAASASNDDAPALIEEQATDDQHLVTDEQPAILSAAVDPITEPATEAIPAPEVPQSPPQDQAFRIIGQTLIPTKDMIMDMTTSFGSGLNDVMAGAQDKAKEAFEKSSSMLGEVGSFTRGNVEAVVESGKILAAGLQDMSTNLVAEGRSSFETMTADLKELAASKTPADFFKAQGEIMRKSLDTAVAYGSKNSEAMLKLASDVFAPLSGRVNVAVEKAKMPLA